MSDSLKEVLYLTTEQFEELRTNGTITVDNQTITYKPNEVVYITPDDTNEKLDLVEMEAQGLVTSVNFSSGCIVTSRYCQAIQFPNGGIIYPEQVEHTFTSDEGTYKFVFSTNESTICALTIQDDGGQSEMKVYKMSSKQAYMTISCSGAEIMGDNNLISLDVTTGYLDFTNCTFKELTSLTISTRDLTSVYGYLHFEKQLSHVSLSGAWQFVDDTGKIIVPYEFLEDYKTALPDLSTYIDAYVLASSLNTEETETYRIYAHNIWLSFTYEDETSGSVDFTVYTSSNTSLKTPEDFYNALGYIKVCAVGTPSAALSECYFAVTMTTTDGYYFKVNGKKITVKSIIDSIYEV